MSKIGKQPVKLPEGVSAEITHGEIKIKGPKGELSQKFPTLVKVILDGDSVVVSSNMATKQAKSTFGTIRALIANMAAGVSRGWSKQLELVGTGYRAEVQGKDLVLTIGFSHPVKVAAPDGISFKVEKTIITIEGTNRELVGQIAANIRAIRPPEPYKGKGIKYVDEIIRRKAGKAAKTVGAPA